MTRYTRNSDSRIFTIKGEEEGFVLVQDELSGEILRMKPAAFRGRYTEIKATYVATMQALEPFRASIEARIIDSTTKAVAAAYVILEKDDFDANVSTKYPMSNMGRVAYLEAKERYSFIRKWTVSDDSRKRGFGINAPEYRLKIEPEELAAKIRKEAAAHANDVIRAYAHKLTKKEDDLRSIRKAAAVTGAVYEGALWSHSFMRYDLADGSSHIWRTNMILNVSCLGKLFNQFPTRLMPSPK